LIIELASWLRAQSGDQLIPGGRAIAAEFAIFASALPGIYRARQLDLAEATFGDLTNTIAQYLTSR
jgi:hypothetical protein